MVLNCFTTLIWIIHLTHPSAALIGESVDIQGPPPPVVSPARFFPRFTLSLTQLNRSEPWATHSPRSYRPRWALTRSEFQTARLIHVSVMARIGSLLLHTSSSWVGHLPLIVRMTHSDPPTLPHTAIHKHRHVAGSYCLPGYATWFCCF